MTPISISFSKDRFKNYLTGDAKIDAEHWTILTLAKSVMEYLEDPISCKQDDCGCSEAIDSFLSVFDQHLVEEEAYMDLHNYPYRAHHKEGHVDFHAKVRKLIADLRLPTMNLKWQEYRMLNLVEVYYEHIDHYDAQMVTWVKANSKEPS